MKELPEVLLTSEDVLKIKTVLTFVAQFDVVSLSSEPNLVVPENPLFWKALRELPVTLIPPPDNFFALWTMTLSVTNLILSFRGPMWTREEGPSEMHLYIDKYLDTAPSLFKLVDYRMP